MSPTKAQALALVSALFATECRGVDAEGNEYSQERNAHFLDSMRVLYPNLPSQYELLVVIKIPDGARPEDYRRGQAAKQTEKRAIFADILREIASAVSETEGAEVPF